MARICALVWLLVFCAAHVTSTGSDETVVIDGIKVSRESVRHLFDEDGNRRRVETGTHVVSSEDPLELEDPAYTDQLPTKCQVCRLMIEELTRRLAKLGQIKTVTKTGRNLYYKDDMVLSTVLSGLCDEMKNYSYVKNAPFRYKKWAKSPWRKYVEEVTKDSKIKHWVWNYSEDDIDDPTGEIRRLTKQCQQTLTEHEDTFSRWFFKAQKKDPISWICRDRILLGDEQSCLWKETLDEEEPPANEENIDTKDDKSTNHNHEDL